MSSYYHEFIPGFNLWYIMAPLFLGIMIIVGHYKYRMVLVFRQRTTNSPLVIRKRYGDSLMVILSVIFTLIEAVMILTESGRGLLQWFDNRSAHYGTGMYGVALVVVMITVVYGIVLFYTARFTANVHAGRLKKYRSQIMDERWKKTFELKVKPDFRSK